MNENQLTMLRRERVGFIFQAFNLMSALTVEQNVGLPFRLAGRRPDRASGWRCWAGWGWRSGAGTGRASSPAGSSSGSRSPGRSSCGRRSIFADEPTGALDTQTAVEVLQLLARR